MILDNASYNKIKLLYKLSEMQWFIEKHALNDPLQQVDQACTEALLTLQQDLHKHIEKLQKICLPDQPVVFSTIGLNATTLIDRLIETVFLCC